MTLENLFAQAAQGRTFLAMCVCGLLLGLMTQIARWLRGKKPWLGLLGDAAAALSLGPLMLGVLLRSGAGLRAYAILGLLIGLTLYAAGLGRLLTRLARAVRIPFRHRPKPDS